MSENEFSGLTKHVRQFADLVLLRRMGKALEDGAARYPIFRVLRFAARVELEALFDAIALDGAWRAQRLGTGVLILDGEGIFVAAYGNRKLDYCSCNIDIWAADAGRAAQAMERILAKAGSTRITEIRGGVAAFIARYLDAPETVLVLQGPPGTGKTRLIRAILGEISRRKGELAEALYTGEMKALESDEIFVKFITGTHDAFVIEDADHLLKPRADGNDHLHRSLAIADGVVRAQGRKIIFSTNLPNVGDLDDALIRPGRCFARVHVRALTDAEARALAQELGRTLETKDGSRRSLSEIYAALR
jgi:hypothetical protein